MANCTHPADGASLGSYFCIKTIPQMCHLYDQKAFSSRLCSLKTLSIKLQFCISMLSRQNFRQLVKKDWFWSKNSENGLTKTALAAKVANYCWNGFLFWGGKGWNCNTDRQTISLTSYTGVCRFFFQLNLLPPYSLCSQGDNLILESDTFVCSGDESKSCHITSIFALA